MNYRCAEIVFSKDGRFSRRCPNPAKHDPDAEGIPTKCGVHSRQANARREKAREARLEAERQSWAKQGKAQEKARRLQADAEDILRKIATGHNDPRSLALEWVERKDGEQ
jgi:hypothetical protein